MKQFTKKYQVWTPVGERGFLYGEFDSLDECIAADKPTGEWYITKRVSLSVKESDELSVKPVTTIKNVQNNFKVDEEVTPATEAYLKGGGIGKLTF